METSLKRNVLVVSVRHVSTEHSGSERTQQLYQDCLAQAPSEKTYMTMTAGAIYHISLQKRRDQAGMLSRSVSVDPLVLYHTFSENAIVFHIFVNNFITDVPDLLEMTVFSS